MKRTYNPSNIKKKRKFGYLINKKKKIKKKKK
ncbi:MAG: 50S ribosomal protein L34 [Candidatus Shikimatogenerans sp. Tmey]